MAEGVVLDREQPLLVERTATVDANATDRPSGANACWVCMARVDTSSGPRWVDT